MSRGKYAAPVAGAALVGLVAVGGFALAAQGSDPDPQRVDIVDVGQSGSQDTQPVVEPTATPTTQAPKPKPVAKVKTDTDTSAVQTDSEPAQQSEPATMEPAPVQQEAPVTSEPTTTPTAAAETTAPAEPQAPPTMPYETPTVGPKNQ